MKNLCKNTVLGLFLIKLILAFSTPTLAQDSGKAPVQPVEPANAPPKEPVGYDPHEATRSYSQALQGLKSEIATTAPRVQENLKIITKNIEEYVTNQQACKDREDKANTYCMESRNPDVKNYLVVSQVLMTGVSGMAEACSKFKQVMDAGSKMLTAYQAACSSWRGYCHSSCGGAKKNVTIIKKKTEELQTNVKASAEKLEAAEQNPAKKGSYIRNAMEFSEKLDKFSKQYIDRELIPDDGYKSVAKKYETCQSYAKELAGAAVGLVQMAVSYGQANGCEKKTTATGPTPVDCSNPENKKNNMTCICQDAPRTQGCNSGLDSTIAAQSANSLRSASTSDYVPGKASSAPGAVSQKSERDLASKVEGDLGSPGSPIEGGGSSGLDGGSGGNGTDSGAGTGQKSSGLNTNILGGEGGGGGGGSAWSGYESDSNNGLRQYLPGGAKDPTVAGVAGQAVVTKEVTSQGGKSNWEKIRERYRDNKPRLLEY